MENVKIINKELVKLHGVDASGRPRYRLVWSDDCLEYRNGVFNDFYHDLFLRQVEEVRETKKYPYIKERWILEKLFFPKEPNPELPGIEKGYYELAWVLQDKSGNYLRPNLRAIEFFIWSLERSPRETKAQMEEKEIKRREEDVAFMEEYLGEKMLTGTELGEQVSLTGKRLE
jgi:hypothetical protein